MQVLQERKPVRSWAIADTASEPAIDRMRKLALYAKLKSASGTTGLCLKTIGGSKATCCRRLDRYRRRGLESQSRCPQRVRGRQWTKQQERQVLHLCRGYPPLFKLGAGSVDKRKLWKVLSKAQGLSLSLSTVGRILARLARLKRIRPASFDGMAGQAQRH